MRGPGVATWSGDCGRSGASQRGTPCHGGEYQHARGATGCKDCKRGHFCEPGAAAALPSLGGTISGRCSRCGHLAEGVRCTDDGAIDFPPALCYEGCHRAGEAALTELRVQTIGEAACRQHFGSEEA